MSLKNISLLLPILICFITAILCCLSWSWQKPQKIIHLIGAFFFLSVTILLFYTVTQHQFVIVQIGGYPAPFGISLVADYLSAIMLLLTGLTGFCVAIYAAADIFAYKQAYGFFPMYWILMTGISGAFSSGDIFNLYVWFEVMLIASFVLMVIGNRKIQLEGTIKYVALNLAATILMLLAIAFLYGSTGTLNMADLANHLQTQQQNYFIWITVLMFALAFSIKSALFPLYFWLPASYHTTSVPASAIFAGMLTKVGIYALIRLFTLIYIPALSSVTLQVLLICSALTMFTGVLGAVSQFNFRRILSFHVISQVGYMAAGLAMYQPIALTAAIFYIVHHVIVKTNLFLVSGIVKKIQGNFNLKKLGGLYHSHPFIALLFLVPAFALAGIPPLSGFWAKLLIIQAALKTKHFVILLVALFVSLATLFSMFKIWSYAFYGQVPKEPPFPLKLSYRTGLLIPVIMLTTATLILSIFPGLLYHEAKNAATQLTHPQYYIHAVLGD